MFGPKKDEVTGGWRKLHKKELRDSYSSPSIILTIKSRRMKLAAHVARKGKNRTTYRLLAEKPEGQRSLGRRRRWWEDNINMDLIGEM
jgi:hypothetical protein